MTLTDISPISSTESGNNDATSLARRGLLVTGATAVIAANAATRRSIAFAAPATTGSAFTRNSSSWHLARRATTGATKSVVDAIAKNRLAWLDAQLKPSSVDDTAFNKLYPRFGGSQSTPIWSVQHQIRTKKIKGWEHKFAVQCEHIARLAWSQRQIQAQMVEFWANHINVPVLADDVDESRAHYQATIRSRALGKYADLLVATSLHPAMLTFLGNRTSYAEHPNENQGRELLELHSLGVGNYSETDVLNATRVLTGLSVDNESGEFEYKPWYHWTGKVTVLKWSHGNTSSTGGLAVAKSLIGYLARHPATAQRICTKLAQYFVADTPPTSLIQKMASTYLANDTAIAPVLKLMFTSSEFNSNYGAVTRRPLESILATIRALGLQCDVTGYEGVKGIAWAIGDTGHSPMNWPTPDGYPLSPQAWNSSTAILQRWNFIRSLVSAWWPETLVRPNLLSRLCPGASLTTPNTLPATHGNLVDKVATTLFGRTLSATDRAAVLTFLNVSESTQVTATSAAVTWQFYEWIALLLSSPYHMYR
ncbi:MAG: DUF1800 domain-containing protein [Actinomycetota bacterium]